jgi:hypothetical protein
MGIPGVLAVDDDPVIAAAIARDLLAAGAVRLGFVKRAIGEDTMPGRRVRRFPATI